MLDDDVRTAIAGGAQGIQSFDSSLGSQEAASFSAGLPALVQLYTDMSDLSDTIALNLSQLQAQAGSVNTISGLALSLPGVAAAVAALKQSSGAMAGAGAGDASLIGNVMAIQQIVWGHMYSLNDTIEAYQSIEGFALEKVNAAGSAIST